MAAERLLIDSRYSVEEQVAETQMATVYKAYDLDSHRHVAVKVLNTRTLQGSIAQEAYKREIQALENLVHPNIVQILGHGASDDDDHRYIVLEWLSGNLRDLVAEHSFSQWESFYYKFGRPVLDAVVFAQGKGVIHRDIKPSNVLLDDKQTPKLADFGIATIKELVGQNVTLGDFRSVPFAPPEFDDAHRQDYDVYSYAALSVVACTPGPVTSYPELHSALQNIQAPAGIKDLLTRCLSRDRSVRPVNALLLSKTIEQILAREGRYADLAGVCNLELTGRAHSDLRNELGDISESRAKLLIEEDLNSGAGFQPWRFGDGEPDPDGVTFSVAGTRFRYKMKISNRDARDRLAILQVFPSTSARLEQMREKAWPCPHRFSFGYVDDVSAAAEVVRDIEYAVDGFASEERRREAQEEEQRLLGVWRRVLDAKDYVERRSEWAVDFAQAYVDGRRLWLESVDETQNTAAIGDPVEITDDTGNKLVGEVDDVSPDSICIYINEGNLTEFSGKGTAKTDAAARRAAVFRQKAALERVAEGNGCRADLATLLLRPTEVTAPMQERVDTFLQPYLDDDKKDVVELALGTTDFFLVDGPPGTGKTSVIAETVGQILKRNPESRILISSQTHVALDNAIERISAIDPNARIVRLAQTAVGKVAEPVAERFLLRSLVDKWAADAERSGERFLERWSKDKGLDLQELRLILMLRRLAFIRDSAALMESRLVAVEEEEVSTATDISQVQDEFLLEDDQRDASLTERHIANREELNLLKERIAALKADEKRITTQLVAMGDGDFASFTADELRELSPSRHPSADVRQLEQLLALQIQWRERLRLSRSFEWLVIGNAQIVAATCVGLASYRGIDRWGFDYCIIDEASKANASEVMIPLSVSRKWMIVGDDKQLPPYYGEVLYDSDALRRFRLSREDITYNFFVHMQQNLPVDAKRQLISQYRMVPPIGNLVSEVFYDGNLESRRPAVPGWWDEWPGSRVTWFSTSKRPGVAERRVGTSYQNDIEAEIVVDVLKELALMASGSETSVAVITGYAAQLALIGRLLPSTRAALGDIRLELSSVDAFQGREADVVIFSLVRSNPSGRLGFLEDQERLNVGLSRARELLLIVGSFDFAVKAGAESCLADVSRYVKTHRDCRVIEV